MPEPEHSVEQDSAGTYFMSVEAFEARLPLSSPQPQPQPRTRVYLPALDGLRFLAFLAVFLHHVPFHRPSAILTTVHHVGWAGVELFFVISSFLFFRLLTQEHEQQGRIDVLRFYLRRTLRIWPIYFLFCLGAFAFSSLAGQSAPMSRLVGELLFVDNFMLSFGAVDPILGTGHLWTLSFEEQVYLLIPVAFWGARRLGVTGSAWAALAIASLATLARWLMVTQGAEYQPIFVLPFLRPEPILVGALLGLGFGVDRLRAVPRPMLAAVAFLLLSPVVFGPSIRDMGANQLYFYPTLALAMGLFIFLAVESSGPVVRFLGSAPMRALGKVSYGLYVYHIVSILCVQRLALMLGMPLRPQADLGDWLVLTLLAFALTAAVAFASYQWIEKPILRYKERFALVLSRPA